jgi:hypothetical protein
MQFRHAVVMQQLPEWKYISSRTRYIQQMRGKYIELSDFNLELEFSDVSTHFLVKCFSYERVHVNV